MGSVFYNIPHIFVQDSITDADLLKKIAIVSDVEAVVVSTVAGEAILRNIGNLPSIRKVIVFTEHSRRNTSHLIRRLREHGITSISFDELVDIGKKNPSDLVHPQDDDIALVLFTSGKLNG